MVSRQRGVACSVAVVVVLVCARRQTNGFYSKRGQDQWVRHHLLWGQALGFFVEFGARDGVAHSNSAYFERTLGWRGSPGLTRAVSTIRARAGRCREGGLTCGLSSTDERVRGHVTEVTQALRKSSKWPPCHLHVY